MCVCGGVDKTSLSTNRNIKGRKSQFESPFYSKHVYIFNERGQQTSYITPQFYWNINNNIIWIICLHCGCDSSSIGIEIFEN